MGRGSASFIAVLLAAAGSTVGLVGPADAQPANRLGEALIGRQAPPQVPAVARYVSDQGPSFILDRSTPTALLRFDGSSEVWVLRAKPGAGGDIVYYNDLGQPMLRATRLGGLTLYHPSRPAGLAAQVAGAASPILLVDMGPSVAERRLAQANVRMAVAAGRPTERGLELELPPVRVTARTAAVLVDTSTLIAEAFEQIAKRPSGLQLLDRVDKVQVVLTEGPPNVVFSQGVLQVSVRPVDGVAGRPSSLRMIVTLTGR
jgi:hypothetical protein